MGNITWQNDKRKLSDLIPWPINPAQIGKAEAKRLEESLDEFGQVQTIAISPANEILDGHQRQIVWGASKKFGMDYEVDVRVSSRELTEQERKKLVIFLRKGTVGQFDFDLLANNFDVPDLLDWGFSERDLQLGGFDLDQAEGDDPGAQIDKAEELRVKWGVQLGQLWRLGDHRLICGDCTDKAVVEKVMHGVKASLCFTDPPYGVKYTGGTKKWAMLENDDEVNMYAASLPLIAEFTDSKAVLYLCYASVLSLSVFIALRDARWVVRSTIIWNKNNAQFGALGAQYHQKHETIGYCYKDKQTPYWFGPNNEITVWDIDRANANEFHPTEKPTELYERGMRNSAPKDCIVFEPFLGSGTGVIACERLERKCRAVEIDPGYCAVAIDRWVTMTGGTPELVQCNTEVYTNG
jgi:DNA modification methylase